MENHKPNDGKQGSEDQTRNDSAPSNVGQPSEQNQRASTKGKAGADVSPPHKHSTWTKPVILQLIFDFVLMVSTSTYAVFAIKQWMAMKDQVTQMQESGGQTDRLIRLYQQQLAQLTKQAGDTHDLAIAAGKQADATNKTAAAAQSAATTAKDTLHVSERAYLTNNMALDTDNGAVNLILNNSGHIPSGSTEVVVHLTTMNVDNPLLSFTDLSTAVERHWSRHQFQSVAPGNTFNIAVPVRQMDKTKLDGGYQLIMVVGFIAYNDGFPNSPQQRWPFCGNTVYHRNLKKVFMVPCDAGFYLPRVESLDGYPNNEQK